MFENFKLKENCVSIILYDMLQTKKLAFFLLKKQQQFVIALLEKLVPIENPRPDCKGDNNNSD